MSGAPAWRYLIRRLAFVPIALAALLTASFMLVNLIPGDPAEAIVGASGSAADVEAVRVRLGLDKPFLERYVAFGEGVLTGHFGASFYSNAPVLDEIKGRAVSSLELVIPTLIVGIAAGVFLGTLGACFSGRTPDRIVGALVSMGQACPGFLFGALVIFIFFHVLRVAPAPIGQHSFTDMLAPKHTGATFIDLAIEGDWRACLGSLKYLALPILTGAMPIAVIFAKMTRATVAEALRGPATEYARANALSEFLVIRWALRQSRTPLITYVGILVPVLLGGNAVVETLYAWNGLGQYAVQSIRELDVPVIQAYVLFIGLASLLSYVLLEFVVVMLDPRLSFAEGPANAR
jgi:ABC-type dipeptide/oligopeptide/nickel transport system permease component